jgi:hypothetical protein
MPGKFITCPLCGQGFGSASVGIHVPQCYDKALRRWEQQDPRNRGPKPVLPTRAPPVAPPVELQKYGGVVNKLQTSSAAAHPRVAISQQQQQLDLYATAPMQLSKCRKCGRGFAYDRIQYHESVCVQNKSRKQFNSKKQRLSDFDQFELRAAAGGGAGRKGAPPPRAANRTSWRQQHNEFISAIRSAKQYAVQSKPKYSAPAPTHASQRQPYASSALRNPHMYRNPPQAARASAPQTSRDSLPRVGRGNGPPTASFQFDAPQRQQLVARAYPQSQPQPQRTGGYGGGGMGFGGGAGKVSIVNSNVTSEGMLQAFGRR